MFVNQLVGGLIFVLNNAGNAGGVIAPVSRSLPQGNSIRVDIEIITGRAFVP